MMIQFVDACAGTSIDFEFSGLRSSERKHALQRLDSLDAWDLLVLDRGHPSHEILQTCAAAGLDSIVRVRVPVSTTLGVLDKFIESSEVDAMAVINPPRDGASE